MMISLSKRLIHAIRIALYLPAALSAVQCTLNDEIFSEIYSVDLKDISIKSDTSDLNFMVISDWGFNGSVNQRLVASQMADFAFKVNPAFLVTSGDNFQADGVSSISDVQWQTNFENVYNYSSLMIPWYPALGNHDYMGNPDAQIAYSAYSDIWKMPSRYYSFTKDAGATSSVRFIILDTQGMINELNKYSGDMTKVAQYCWLDSLLSVAPEEWIIVVGHHPVFSAGGTHGDSEEMNLMVKPLLNKYNVDFFICGHDHHFEHAREFREGTDYIVTGTGGETRPAGNNFKTIVSIVRLGFTYISISDDRARLFFITDSGETGYYYERIKEYTLATRICKN